MAARNSLWHVQILVDGDINQIKTDPKNVRRSEGLWALQEW